jgi:hypothetical protein
MAEFVVGADDHTSDESEDEQLGVDELLEVIDRDSGGEPDEPGVSRAELADAKKAAEERYAARGETHVSIDTWAKEKGIRSPTPEMFDSDEDDELVMAARVGSGRVQKKTFKRVRQILEDSDSDDEQMLLACKTQKVTSTPVNDEQPSVSNLLADESLVLDEPVNNTASAETVVFGDPRPPQPLTSLGRRSVLAAVRSTFAGETQSFGDDDATSNPPDTSDEWITSPDQAERVLGPRLPPRRRQQTPEPEMNFSQASSTSNGSLVAQSQHVEHHVSPRKKRRFWKSCYLTLNSKEQKVVSLMKSEDDCDRAGAAQRSNFFCLVYDLESGPKIQYLHEKFNELWLARNQVLGLLVFNVNGRLELHQDDIEGKLMFMFIRTQLCIKGSVLKEMFGPSLWPWVGPEMKLEMFYLTSGIETKLAKTEFIACMHKYWDKEMEELAVDHFFKIGCPFSAKTILYITAQGDLTKASDPQFCIKKLQNFAFLYEITDCETLNRVYVEIATNDPIPYLNHNQDFGTPAWVKRMRNRELKGDDHHEMTEDGGGIDQLRCFCGCGCSLADHKGHSKNADLFYARSDQHKICVQATANVHNRLIFKQALRPNSSYVAEWFYEYNADYRRVPDDINECNAHMERLNYTFVPPEDRKKVNANIVGLKIFLRIFSFMCTGGVGDDGTKLKGKTMVFYSKAGNCGKSSLVSALFKIFPNFYTKRIELNVASKVSDSYRHALADGKDARFCSLDDVSIDAWHSLLSDLRPYMDGSICQFNGKYKRTSQGVFGRSFLSTNISRLQLIEKLCKRGWVPDDVKIGLNRFKRWITMYPVDSSESKVVNNELLEHWLWHSFNTLGKSLLKNWGAIHDMDLKKIQNFASALQNVNPVAIDMHFNDGIPETAPYEDVQAMLRCCSLTPSDGNMLVSNFLNFFKTQLNKIPALEKKIADGGFCLYNGNGKILKPELERKIDRTMGALRLIFDGARSEDTPQDLDEHGEAIPVAGSSFQLFWGVFNKLEKAIRDAEDFIGSDQFKGIASAAFPQ